MDDDYDLGEIPVCAGVQLCACEDAGCGAHFVLFDHEGSPIIQAVCNSKQTLELLKALQTLLYEKAVERS